MLAMIIWVCVMTAAAYASIIVHREGDSYTSAERAVAVAIILACAVAAWNMSTALASILSATF
mgnify:FL=1